LADEAGSQPVGAGGQLSDSQPLTAPDVGNPRWQRSVLADERTIPRLRQELCVDQCTKERVTDIAIQSPQTLCLRGSQTEARHFDELSLYSLEHVIDTHGSFSPSRPVVLQCEDILCNRRTRAGISA
jgi:hypothetical protein